MMEDRQDKLILLDLLADCFEGNLAQVVEGGVLKVSDWREIEALRSAMKRFKKYLREEME